MKTIAIMMVLFLVGVGADALAQFRVLHTFTGPDGANPNSGLVLADGVLYGTTQLGGYYEDPLNSCGVVFKVNTNGSGFEVLKEFHRNDGANPIARLAMSDGVLYGTTLSGGSFGTGTVFKFNVDGRGYTVLHSFSGGDGVNPDELLLANNILYGAAINGGPFGLGALFKINIDGTGFSVLYDRPGYPHAAPVLAGTTLFGTTTAGSANGSVYSLNTDGTGYRVLHSFLGNDGAMPSGSVVLSRNTLYGVTRYDDYWNGSGFGAGTIFRVDTDGSNFELVERLDWTEGVDPVGGVVISGAMLYGATGANGGTLFRVRMDGTHHTVLKQFSNPEGDIPCGGLLLSGGVLYGMTWQGGVSNKGVVFSLSLPPPQITRFPQSQTAEIGAPVRFAVEAEGADPLSYQWFLDNTNAIAGATNNVLEWSSVTASQTGAYSVKVTDIGGSILSSNAVLSVITPVLRTNVPALKLTGASGAILAIETAATLLMQPAWLPLDSVKLTSPAQFYFDLTSPLPSQRFYRTSQAGSVPLAALDLHFIPALTLTGVPRASVRVDCINQFGPTDAWVTLATVTLTNTSQEYFDTSAIGQPARLYRLVPSP